MPRSDFRLSEAQWKMLASAAEGNAFSHLHGRSEHGGGVSTHASLCRLHLLTLAGITPLGLDVLGTRPKALAKPARPRLDQLRAMLSAPASDTVHELLTRAEQRLGRRALTIDQALGALAEQDRSARVLPTEMHSPSDWFSLGARFGKLDAPARGTFLAFYVRLTKSDTRTLSDDDYGTLERELTRLGGPHVG